MNNRYQDLAREAGLLVHNPERMPTKLQKFAELLIQECITKIETHRIPVGNSAAGEMACEWTYQALKEVRDDIKEHFGVEP
jgi:hypothetical protein